MDHPSRRFLLASALAPALGLRPFAAALAATDPNAATAFVQRTGQDLTGAINATRLSVAQRREQVAIVLRRMIDMDGVGRFILGRWWRQATPAELTEYRQLFEETLIRNLSSRFGEYQGVTFRLGRAMQRAEDDVLVNTIIERPNSPAFSLDWRVADVGGQPKIVDVIAEGTSLRLTQRSEYSAVIQQHNGQVAALLVAMRQQIAQMAAREPGR